jgi:hypothetical protein
MGLPGARSDRRRNRPTPEWLSKSQQVAVGVLHEKLAQASLLVTDPIPGVMRRTEERPLCTGDANASGFCWQSRTSPLDCPSEGEIVISAWLRRSIMPASSSPTKPSRVIERNASRRGVTVSLRRTNSCRCSSSKAAAKLIRRVSLPAVRVPLLWASASLTLAATTGLACLLARFRSAAHVLAIFGARRSAGRGQLGWRA